MRRLPVPSLRVRRELNVPPMSPLQDRPGHEAELVAIRQRLADLAARIAWHQRELAVLRQQRRDEDDGRLLRALVIGTRGSVFSVGDVYARATFDPDVAAAVGDMSPKQLGKRLARVVDRELEGLTVRRVVVSRTGWLWQIDINQDGSV